MSALQRLRPRWMAALGKASNRGLDERRPSDEPAEPDEVVAPAPRVTGSAVADGAEVKLSPGGVVNLINISETGALVETSARYGIGASVAVCIGGSRPQRLPGRVVRCHVCGIHRDSTMSYQIGIDFDAPVRADVSAGGSSEREGAAVLSEPGVGPRREAIEEGAGSGAVAQAVARAPIEIDAPEPVEELVNEW